MSKTVVWLLSEIEHKVNGHLSPEAQQNLLDEVASHLDAAIRARIEVGSAPERAEQEAVVAFGQPDAYIKELLAVHERPVSRTRNWLQKGKPDSPTIVTFCASCLWFPIYGLLELRYGGMHWLGYLGMALVASFAYFSYRSRRVQIFSLGIATLGVYFISILMFSTLWLSPAHHGSQNMIPIPLWQASSVKKAEANRIGEIDNDLADFQRGLSMHFEQMTADQIAHLTPSDHSLLFRVLGTMPHHDMPRMHPWGAFNGPVVTSIGPGVTGEAIPYWKAGAVTAIRSLREARYDSLHEIIGIEAAQKSLPFGDFAFNFSKCFGLVWLWFTCGSILNYLCVALAGLADFARSKRSRAELA